MKNGEITEGIIAAAIEVHRNLGPGLLESAYEECLDEYSRFPFFPSVASDISKLSVSYFRQMLLS
jgi:hypothetical protein